MFTQSVQNNIDTLYLQKLKIIEISKILDLDYKKTIAYIKKKRLKEVKLLQEKNQLLYFIKEKKYTRKEISQKLQKTPEQITYLMKYYKLKPDFKTMNKERIKNDVIKKYKEQPISVKEMCQEMNVSYSVISRIYIENNLKKIKSSAKHLLVLSEEDYLSIINDLQYTKLSLQQIAAKYNVSRQRIFQIKKSNQVKRP